MKDVPLLIMATTVSTYWLCVALMVVRSWIRFHGPAGAVPKIRRERLMWILWVPVIAAWITLPWLAWDASGDEATMSTASSPWSMARWAVSGLGVLALGLTMRCWLAMGSNWTMAVNPKKQSQLVTEGPFALVRHPIYTLSMSLMLCTVLVVGTLPMLAVGGIHLAMIIAKAHSEERYLGQLHGDSYVNYCKSTTRFIPWPRSPLRPRTPRPDVAG